MPIKGISERRRLPRLGKIRLGEKRVAQSGAEYPKAVDHFVLPPELAEQFGLNAKELPIMFLTNDDPEQWYKAYSKTRGLVCRGDGEVATALIDMETGDIASKDAKKTELREVPCNPKTCPIYQKQQCKGIMNLQFYVRETETLGVYQLDTSSVNSITNINSSLHMLRSVAGQVAMIPVTLVVEPREVSPDGKKKTVWVLQLHINMSDIQDMRQRLGAPIVHALPAPETGEAPDDMYTEDAVSTDPSFESPKQPVAPRAMRPKPSTKTQDKQPQSAKIEGKDGPKSYSGIPGSITPETQQRVNGLMKADETGLIAHGLVKRKGWGTDNSGELSEYQGQVIIKVCKGEDERDVVMEE